MGIFSLFFYCHLKSFVYIICNRKSHLLCHLTIFLAHNIDDFVLH